MATASARPRSGASTEPR